MASEVVQADLSNLDETAAAFARAWGVFALTQFYVHGFEAEQLYGRNIVNGAVPAGVKFLVWSTVEGREGEWKALIEERVIASGIPYTFIHIPMYYGAHSSSVARIKCREGGEAYDLSLDSRLPRELLYELPPA